MDNRSQVSGWSRKNIFPLHWTLMFSQNCRSFSRPRSGFPPSGKRHHCLPCRRSRLRAAPFKEQFGSYCWKFPMGKPVLISSRRKALADQLRAQGISAAAQAVGGAVGHNPISILIPCHRVVGSNGSLTGYAGGVGRKYFLLELEGADMTKLYLPKRGTAL